MGEKRGTYRILVGKPKRKRPLGRPRRRWKDMISQQWDGAAWTGSIWLRTGTGGGQL